MKKKKPPSNDKSDEYSRFEDFAKQIISVPKSEIDKREAEYQKARKAAKRKRCKSNSGGKQWEESQFSF